MRAFALLFGLTFLLVFIGGAIGGSGGMVIALGFAIFTNFTAYFYSHKLVLKMYKAVHVTEVEAPGFHQIVREMTERNNLPMPELYIVQNSTPNAFATGRNPKHSVVAVTTGLIDTLSEDEIAGVIAHELAHIHGRDILISTVAATIAGAISSMALFAQFAYIFGRGNSNSNPFGGLLLIIFAPMAAGIIQMSISRSREYRADAVGARFCGSPQSLANALRKISQKADSLPEPDISPSTAHMLIYNPLRGRSMSSLFSTHPPIDERIRRLEGMNL